MHEFAITQGILDVAVKGALDQEAKRIKVIHLSIGSMTDIVGDCVEFYFDELSKGTVAQGARLEIKRIEARARCGNCSLEFSPSELMFQCPECGQFGAEIITGKELEVASIEVEMEDE